MAAASLLALIDDIASVLDDVALLAKAATKKTAGVLGDDLALNAQQVSGVKADRELPVVWAVAKGSLRNKAILVPAALAVSAFAAWAVTPLLMVGGAFLCYEGVEKLAHRLVRREGDDAADHAELVKAVADPAVDLVAFERDKIRGAVRTDFILSAEIIAITLGTVAATPLLTQLSVLTAIAIIMTVGVYGLVAGIVKLDDGGLHLSRKTGNGGLARLQRAVGVRIVGAAPYLMKGLSIAGTAAMFLVGGGILTHGIPVLHRWIETAVEGASGLPRVGGLLEAIGGGLLDAAVGIVAGALAMAAVSLARKIWPAKQSSTAGPA